MEQRWGICMKEVRRNKLIWSRLSVDLIADRGARPDCSHKVGPKVVPFNLHQNVPDSLKLLPHYHLSW